MRLRATCRRSACSCGRRQRFSPYGESGFPPLPCSWCSSSLLDVYCVCHIRRIIHEPSFVNNLGDDEALHAGRYLHGRSRSEEHTSELQSRLHLVCRLLLEKKKKETEVT